MKGFGLMVSQWVCQTGHRGQRKQRDASRSRLARACRIEALESRLFLSASLVKDINIDTPDSNPSQFTESGGFVYFTATQNGRQDLWRTDGTGAGITHVDYLNPGYPISPRELTNFKGTLYFCADFAGPVGRQIWKAGGTPAITTRVTNFYQGATPRQFLVIGDTLFFTVDDGKIGEELWKTDGTAAGTVLVKDIRPGISLSSSPANLTNVNGTLFFTANDGAHGTELWKSDGTADGTAMVADIVAGTGSSSPANLTNVSGTLFFTANDGIHGVELWKSDGTAAGTAIVADLTPGAGSSSLGDFTSIGGRLYFTATDGSGTKLWSSDGTQSGTWKTSDVNVVGSGAGAVIAAVNGAVIFPGTDGSDGVELWKTNGTPEGTARVMDINPGPGSSDPSSFVVINGVAFFTADDGASGIELWRTDGTAEGTLRVLDINPGPDTSSPSYLTNAAGRLFFSATDGIHGNEPWVSDGTPAGTRMAADVDNRVLSSSPSELTAANGWLFFVARARNSAVPALMKSDGTADGTSVILFNNPHGLIALNNALLFSSGGSLWRTDGTVDGTINLNAPSLAAPYLQSAQTDTYTIINGVLYYAGAGTSGAELWRTDGTAAGTYLVRDINPAGDSHPSFLTNVNGTLFFVADDGNGFELWKSDGTTLGTTKVTEIVPGPSGITFNGSDEVSKLVNFNGILIFSANDLIHGNELWRSDGTAAGTWMIKDIQPGPSDSLYQPELTVSGGEVYFCPWSAPGGPALWKTDGTAAGTVPVASLPDPGFFLADLNGTLLFALHPNDFQIWKSDGTAAGTTMLKSAGPDQLDPMVRAGNSLYMVQGGSVGKVWKTDGTADGTTIVGQVLPGPTLSNPDGLTNANGNLFFEADDGAHGQELWKYITDDAAPLGLTASSDPAKAQITLHWAYSGDGATGFVVERGTINDGFSAVATVAGDARSYVDASLALSTSYSYRIYALRPEGPSQYSGIASAATPGTAAPSDLSATTLTDTRIRLNWTDNSLNETGFRIERRTGPDGQFAPVATVPSGTATYLDSGLTAGTLYFYRVIAVSAAGESAPSNIAQAITLNADARTPYTGTAPIIPATIQAEDFDNGGEAIAYHDTTPQNTGGAYRSTGVDIASIPGGYAVVDAVAGEWLTYTLNATAGTYDLEARVYSTGLGGTFHVEIDGQNVTGPLSVPDSVPAQSYLNVVAGQIPIGAGSHLMRLVMDSNAPGGSVGNFDSVRLFTSQSTPPPVPVLRSAIALGSAVQLTWDPLVYESGILVQRRTVPTGTFQTIAQADRGATSFIDSAALGQHYAYRLIAFNSAGASGPSGEAQLAPAIFTSGLLLDINPGAAGSNPGLFATLGSTAYFAADDGVHGSELWKTDGTAAGTSMVKDINPTGSSFIAPSLQRAIVKLNGVLLFAANDGVHGKELWKTDGTPQGTALVSDILPGSAGSNPANFVVSGNLVFFLVYEDGLAHLWKTDGTAQGTQRVSDTVVVVPEGNWSTTVPGPLAALNGKVYFPASTNGPGTLGRELYQSDGTPQGTTVVKDIYPGPAGSGPTLLQVVDGTLYFFDYPDDGTYSLWKSDGTTEGTVRMASLPRGSGFSEASWLASLKGVLYFSAWHPTLGYTLWRSDGTPAGTMPVLSSAAISTPSYTTAVGDFLYFYAYYHGYQWLMRSDGTEAGTVPLVPDSPNDAGRGYITQLSSLAIASGDKQSNGTANGTFATGMSPGPLGLANVPTFVVIGSMILGAGYSPSTGIELYRLDTVAPSAVAQLGDIRSDRVSFTWPASNALTVTVERRTASTAWTVIGTVAAQQVAYTDSTAMAGTAYSYRITIANFAGSSVTQFTVPTPAVPVPSAPDLLTDSGPLPDDNVTSVRTPAFAGTGQPGSAVTLYSDAVAVGSGIVDVGGAYHITTATLADGIHNITAVASDAHAKQSAVSGALQITIDSVPLTVSIDPVAHVFSTAVLAADEIVLSFNKPVYGLDRSRLSLTRDGASNLIGADQTLGSPDRVKWTIAGLSSVDAAPGLYTISLINPGDLTDLAGNPLSSASGQFLQLFTGSSAQVNGAISVTPNQFDPAKASVFVNGALSYVAPFNDLRLAIVNGGDGNDVVGIVLPNSTRGLHLLSLNLGGGTNTLNLIGGINTLQDSGSSLHFTSRSGAVVNLADSQQYASLSLQDTSRVNMVSQAGAAIRTASLSMSTSARLDLAGNALIVDSTAQDRESVLAAIQALVRSARGSGSDLWGGPGITSSLAAADLRRLTGVAAIVNEKLDSEGNPIPLLSSLNGQAIDRNSILVENALNGDTDLNGVVNFDDYFQINTGFLSNGKLTGYRNGDFNYDHLINFDDYVLINTAFLGQNNLAPLPPMTTVVSPFTVTRAPIGTKRSRLLGKKFSAKDRGARRTTAAPGRQRSSAALL